MSNLIPVELRRARASLFVIFLAQGGGFALLFSRLPTLKDRFELSDSALALLTLALPLLAGVATLVTGNLVRRVKSDILLRVAIVTEYVALIAIGFSPSLLLVLPVWVVMALAFGTVDATMNMKAVALQEKYGRSIVVAFYATYSLAGILAALIASASAAAGMPLSALLTIVAVVVIPILLFTGQWLTVTRVAHKSQEADTPAAAGKVKVPWGPILSIGLVLASTYFIESSAASWGAVYVRDTLGSTDAIAALAFGFYSFAMLLGRVSADFVIRRMGAGTVARACAALAVAGTALVVFAPVPAAAIAGFALAGFGLCVIAPLAFAAAGKIDEYGVAVARANSFTYVGFMLGAGIIGPVADLSTMRIAYAIPLVLSVVVLLNVGRIASNEPAHPADSTAAA